MAEEVVYINNFLVTGDSRNPQTVLFANMTDFNDDALPVFTSDVIVQVRGMKQARGARIIEGSTSTSGFQIARKGTGKKVSEVRVNLKITGVV